MATSGKPRVHVLVQGRLLGWRGLGAYKSARLLISCRWRQKQANLDLSLLVHGVPICSNTNAWIPFSAALTFSRYILPNDLLCFIHSFCSYIQSLVLAWSNSVSLRWVCLSLFLSIMGRFCSWTIKGNLLSEMSGGGTSFLTFLSVLDHCLSFSGFHYITSS